MSLVVIMVTAALIASGLAALFTLINEEASENSTNNIGFECGFMSISASNVSFSTNFITVIIIFLIFDIEVSILITITISSGVTTIETTIATCFIIVVTALLLNEWWQGAIEWKN